MGTTRTWTYNDITSTAEKEIQRLMQHAAAVAATSAEDARTYRDFAYGVYAGWSGLTMGWQEEGDDDRIRALTLGPNNVV
jgi:hypothetical protein